MKSTNQSINLAGRAYESGFTDLSLSIIDELIMGNDFETFCRWWIKETDKETRTVDDKFIEMINKYISVLL